jgi:serine/threonine protein kinase/Flp pilus assembly protein TadD
MVADRSGAAEYSEIVAHVRSCPKCRQISDELTLDDAPVSGRTQLDDGATLAQTLPASADAPETLAEEGQSAAAIRSASSPAETIEMPSPGSSSIDQTELATSARFGSSPASQSLDAHAATLDDVAASSDETTQSSLVAHPKANEPRPAAFAASGVRTPKGPPEYEILSELGRGGMGIVYKARHRRLNRLVALKMIRGGMHADDIQITRFKIEAEAVAALRHPNILQIYDIGESDGLPYVALELLEGGSLADRLRGTSLPPRKAAEWMVPMALAMDAAHRAGIVHRDLKSVNVLFTADEIPKITDFGLAKRLELDEGHTQTGQVMGTPSYMAPEQARGDTKSVGPPADIYALGAILYEMLTGRPPFKGVSAMETVKQVIEVEPVAPSRVQFRIPRDLETICMKCLQKEPRKRYATAREMADDLNRFLHGEPIRARRTPPVERAIKWARRHPTATTFLTMSILAAVSGLVYGVSYWNNLRRHERLAAQHLELVREETGSDLVGVQEARSRNDLNTARVILARRQSLLALEKNPRLVNLLDLTKRMLGEVEKSLDAEHVRLAAQQARDEVQRRYQLFLDRRKAALFQDTQFAGEMLPANAGLTRKLAEQALDVYARRQSEDDWALHDLPAMLATEQKSDVKEGCYELLLILAEAVANQAPLQVDQALRILDCADRMWPAHSRAYHLRKASCLALKNDRVGQAQELALAQQRRPETPFDYFLSGQQEYKQHRWDDATQDFEVALRKKPDHFWAQCMLANCYLRTARPEAAKASLTSCLEAEPDHALLYIQRGLASGQTAAKYITTVTSNPAQDRRLNSLSEFEFDEAEADFQEAMRRLDRTPDDLLRYQLLVNRGRFRFLRGQLEPAAADYQEAIRLNKDLYLAHADLARVYQKQRKSADAIEQFGQAIALKPDFAPLYRDRAELIRILGQSTREQRQAALSDLDMAIRHERSDNPLLAADHTNRGALLYLDGRFEDALEESKLALQVLPDHVEAHGLRIQALLKLNRVDDAIRSCDVALAGGKKSPTLYELRADAHVKRNNYPEAIRDYGRALELRPDDSRLHVLRGWAYLMVESPKLALVDFETAIKLDPAQGDAYNGRGTACVLGGDHLGAVADAREALLRGKADPRITYNAARIYALAAARAAAEVGGEKGRQARLLASRYQDTALQLIREAIEREAPEKRAKFWRETIQVDPAFKAIKPRLKFDDLIATTKQASS